jgi:hypothetical protein
MEGIEATPHPHRFPKVVSAVFVGGVTEGLRIRDAIPPTEGSA